MSVHDYVEPRMKIINLQFQNGFPVGMFRKIKQDVVSTNLSHYTSLTGEIKYILLVPQNMFPSCTFPLDSL